MIQLGKTELLTVGVTIASEEEILQRVETYLTQTVAEPITVVTPNPEQILQALRNPHFRQILNDATIALPDGIGVVLAARYAYQRHKIGTKVGQRIPGVEFMEELAALAALNSLPVALIGGYNDIAKEAFEKLQQTYTGLTGWAIAGPIIDAGQSELQLRNDEKGQYFNQLCQKIQNTRTKMVFIGLGAPKQEYFMKTLMEELQQTGYHEPVVLMAVGGAFDMLSGKVPRAPEFLRTMQLEWLWRLVQEPWRIGRQTQLIAFLWQVVSTYT